MSAVRATIRPPLPSPGGSSLRSPVSAVVPRSANVGRSVEVWTSKRCTCVRSAVVPERLV